MKSIVELIHESREVLGELPFTEDEFIKLLKELDKEKDKKFIEDIFDRIELKWGLGARNFFNGWLRRECFTDDPKDLYKTIQQIPKDRLDRTLGSGSSGFALEIDKDKVIKWFYVGETLDVDIDEIQNNKVFYTYCLRHKSKVFPQVYKVTDQYVVMERLRTGTKKCKEYFKVGNEDLDKKYGIKADDTTRLNWVNLQSIANYLTGNVFYGDPEFSNLDVDSFYNQLDPREKKVFDWFIKVGEESVKGNLIVGDFKTSNLGERKNGDIIWFDI